MIEKTAILIQVACEIWMHYIHAQNNSKGNHTKMLLHTQRIC